MTLKETAELYAALKDGKTLQRREVRVIPGSVDSLIETTLWEDIALLDTDTLRSDCEYRVKPKPSRWRADRGTYYYLIAVDQCGVRVTRFEERGDKSDQVLWQASNYFRTKEDAEAALERFKAILTEYKQKYTTGG